MKLEARAARLVLAHHRQSAGKLNNKGKFAPGAVFAQADERLGKMARILKEFE